MLDQYYLQEIEFELESIEIVVAEINSILTDYEKVLPDTRIKSALGSLLAQFYTGIENILKKLIKANGRNLPKGENWHLELFKYFCDPPDQNLPLLFNEELEKKMGNFRRFRHVVFHGYGFRLDWNIMFDGSHYVNETFAKFKFELNKYLSANEKQ